VVAFILDSRLQPTWLMMRMSSGTNNLGIETTLSLSKI
jgi:hypothetical protein